LEPTANPTSKFAFTRRSGKPTKRHLSLHGFCKALGYAPSQESSGDLQKSKVTGGSDLCRKALWQWIFTRIEPQRTRLNNDTGDRARLWTPKKPAADRRATGAIARSGQSSQTLVQRTCA